MQLKNVEITLGEQKVVSENGLITIKDLFVHKKYVVVRVKKEGYKEILRTIHPQEGQNNINVILVNKVDVVTLKAKEGVVITKDDVTLNFPKNSLIDEAENHIVARLL